MANGEDTLEALVRIRQASKEGWTEINLSSLGLSELPEDLRSLTHLQSLSLSSNSLSSLPEWLGELSNLQALDLDNNQLSMLPPSLGQLTNLAWLNLSKNHISVLPDSIGQLSHLMTLLLSNNRLSRLPGHMQQLTSLHRLDLGNNPLKALPEWLVSMTHLQSLDIGSSQLTKLPDWLGNITSLQTLFLNNNQMKALPDWLGRMTNLRAIFLRNNRLTALQDQLFQLSRLQTLDLSYNQLSELPESLNQLTSLQWLDLSFNTLSALPESLGELVNLNWLDIQYNHIVNLPVSLGGLKGLRYLNLENNPLNPVLDSAYKADRKSLLAYLKSLQDPAQVETLFEAKLVLVGEGGVGKTSLLKAITRAKPRQDEPTTHGVSIEVQALRVEHPQNKGVQIQLNAWDFGGQEVYRVTHQFFFSKRSVYLLVWEPRRGVQQCQVEDWLKLIRLRVGSDAKVLIVSTHARTGERIARIDQPVLREQFGDMIVGFYEVDSLVDDPQSEEKVGIAALKQAIAQTAAGLEQMGMAINRAWREARDRTLAIEEPRISYNQYIETCSWYGLSLAAAKTLAQLMNDLGYIIYYADDEQLKDDMILKPEWLTKAIGFVLEDRTTQEMDGMLPDSRLKEVWYEHPNIPAETRYEPVYYPFFLRLMEKFDVSYRLEDGTASLVAQHVPQVRPPLPWLPEEESGSGIRRIAMACVMDEDPPGLIPWMIVRTHEYSYTQKLARGKSHYLHWQKGMFLRYHQHGEAFLEMRGREFYIAAEAVWPEYFLNILRGTLQKLIDDHWPGLKGQYYFGVPCPEQIDGKACEGRFDIAALRQFLEEGDETIRCQVCRKRQNIVELLYGFEKEDYREQLDRIETEMARGFAETKEEIAGLESRMANYLMVVLRAVASESKDGPRLFTLEPVDAGWQGLFSERYRLQLWCEADGCQHPVFGDVGAFEFKAPREWVEWVAPYANLAVGLLKTLLPMVAPAINVFFGPNTVEQFGIKDHLELAQAAAGSLLREIRPDRPDIVRDGVLSDAETAGVLKLHEMLNLLDPNRTRWGLHRVPTYTGDYLWLCDEHYRLAQSKIPEKWEEPPR